MKSDCGEFELIFDKKASLPESKTVSGGEKSLSMVEMPAWQPPTV